ncbi:MAG: hypothetical protein HY299_15920 [Verrucomicrobia bacterium]|nr:hypothetical protein [Verrucomicrobiota bacterium]
MIDEVINRFDFPRVQTAMQSLGWSYGGESEDLSTEILRGTFVVASRRAPQGEGHPVAGIGRDAVK